MCFTTFTEYSVSGSVSSTGGDDCTSANQISVVTYNLCCNQLTTHLSPIRRIRCFSIQGCKGCHCKKDPVSMMTRYRGFSVEKNLEKFSKASKFWDGVKEFLIGVWSWRQSTIGCCVLTCILANLLTSGRLFLHCGLWLNIFWNSRYVKWPLTCFLQTVF